LILLDAVALDFLLPDLFVLPSRPVRQRLLGVRRTSARCPHPRYWGASRKIVPAQSNLHICQRLHQNLF